MNIIEVVQHTLSEFPQIAALNNGLEIDFTKSDTDNCGLYPTGDQIVKEDIIGNQDRQHNFVLYGRFQSFVEYDRLVNSTFLLDLAYWLEKAAKKQSIEVTINEKTVTGTLEKLRSANGMMYSYDNETLTGPVTYQLQIYAEYHLEMED
ncbi:MAG: hypothetical protein K0S61_4422 [Anaerocolumna sp.]|jgi:hypothetical protein|nr:hypothetical protein [Anaerocolumna sp.]